MKSLYLIIAFAIFYGIYLGRLTFNKKIDIFDFVLLFSYAFFPLLFVGSKSFSQWTSDVTGSKFPFVILFCLLFLIIFWYLQRIAMKIHVFENQIVTIAQELGLKNITKNNK